MNNRERLHAQFDKYIDRAEEHGHKLEFVPINGMTQSIKDKSKKKPGWIKFTLETGITLDSFAPQYRDSLNHLYDENG